MRSSQWRGRTPAVIAVCLVLAACSVDTLPGDGRAGGPAVGGPVTSAATAGSGPATGPAGAPNDVQPEDRRGTPGAPEQGASEVRGSPTGGDAGGRAGAVGSTVGVTSDTITLSASGFWSGPYSAFTNKQYENGFMTWVAEVNQKGGIHGRRLVVKKVDNQNGTPEGAVAACKEEQTNGTFAVVAFASTAVEHDCLDQAGVPALVQVAERDPERWRVVRGLGSQPSEGVAMANFAKAKLGAGTKRVGVVVLNLGLATATAKGFATAARDLGLEVVGTERVEQNQGSFVAELSRLRNAGAEVVVLFVLTEVLGILRDARAINYRPAFTGTIWAADEIAQAGRSLLDGIVALRSYATTDSAGFEEYRAAMSRQGKLNPSTTDALQYGIGRVLGHVLEKAGRDLTRESFVAAADQVRGFDPKLVQPVSWVPPDRIGGRAQFPVVCCNDDGTWRGLGPARSSF